MQTRVKQNQITTNMQHEYILVLFPLYGCYHHSPPVPNNKQSFFAVGTDQGFLVVMWCKLKLWEFKLFSLILLWWLWCVHGLEFFIGHLISCLLALVGVHLFLPHDLVTTGEGAATLGGRGNLTRGAHPWDVGFDCRRPGFTWFAYSDPLWT